MMLAGGAPFQIAMGETVLPDSAASADQCDSFAAACETVGKVVGSLVAELINQGGANLMPFNFPL